MAQSTGRMPLRSALPIVAAAYGRKFGVGVQIGGDTAFTNGRVINLPSIPDTYPHKDALWGYLAHEAAHVRFTDFTVGGGGRLRGFLINALEDCRIERAMIREYPGTAATLNDVAGYMVHAGHYQAPTPECHPGAVLGSYALFWLECFGVGQPVLKPLYEAAEAALDEVFPASVHTRLDVLLRRVLKATSTKEVAVIADDILVMLKDEEDKSRQQSRQDGSDPKGNDDQPQQPGNGGQGEKAESQGENCSGNEGPNQQGDQTQQPAGNGQKQGADAGQDQDSQNGGDQQGSEGESSGDGQQTGISPLAGGCSAGNAEAQAEALQQTLGSGAGDLPQDAFGQMAEELRAQAGRGEGEIVFPQPRARKDAPAGYEVDALSRKARAASSAICQQLMGLVQAHDRSARTTHRRGRRLNVSRLARIAVGDARVFVRTIERVRPNSAVHILVDMSGSMGVSVGAQTQSDVAAQAALAISLAMEAIPGVNPAVTYFNGSAGEAVVPVIKHGGSVRRSVSKFVAKPTGGTPMAAAMWYAAAQMSGQHEERKIMLVVTDGAPCDELAVETAVRRLEAYGVDLYGIGIGCEAVRQHFKHSIVLDDVNQLKSELFRLVKSSLVG